MMNRKEVIEWIKEKVQGKHEESEKFARKLFNKFAYFHANDLRQLAENGYSNKLNKLIESELNKPTLSEELKEKIKQRVDDYYRPIFVKSYEETKNLGLADHIDKSIESRYKQVLRDIDFDDPEDVEEYVELYFKVEEHFESLHKTRNELWKLDIEDYKSAQDLKNICLDLINRIQELNPRKFEESKVFISELMTDFGAFFSKGQVGSHSSVFRVQSLFIDKIISDEHPILQKYKDGISNINAQSNGSIFSVLFWASGRTSENLIPRIDEAKTALEEASKELENKDEAKKILIEFEQVCKVALKNFENQ